MKIFSLLGENIVNKFPSIIISSLSLIAGMAWNDAFSTLINHYYPTDKTKNSYLFKFLYAFIITIIIVSIISIIIFFSLFFK